MFNQSVKYILPLVLIIVWAWFFSTLAIYLSVAFIIALVSKPLTSSLQKIRIRKFSMNRTFAALTTLLAIWTIVFLIATFIIPKAIKEFSSLSSVNPQTVIEKFSDPIYSVQNIYRKFNLGVDEPLALNDFLQQKLYDAFNQGRIVTLLSKLSSIVGNIVVAVFSISFIVFFLLKDPTLPLRFLLIIFPENTKTKILLTHERIENLLQRYFIGLLLQVSIVFVLLFAGLHFTQLNTSQIILVAMVGALLNIIPYIGPILGFIFGMLITALLGVQLLEFHQIVNQLILSASVFIVTQIIDNIILQPLIYSKTVKAHPLEIFFVISMAGYLWGVAAMIVAIPIYTSLRVVLITFFPETEWSKKITKQISDKNP